MYPMRISKFGLIGAAVVLGSCVTIGALAQAGAGQPPPGGARRGGFGQGRFGALGGVTLVSVSPDVLAKELKLTDEQKTAIAAAQMKYQTDLRATFQRPADGSQPDRQAMQAKQRELSTQATKDIETVLKDDQKTDATALLKNLQALQTLRIPYQTYSDLKLTGEQRTKLTAMAADATKDRAAKRAELQAAQQAGDQAKVQEIIQSMGGFGGPPDEKTMAVLTADQKDVVTKYIKDHPARGRRPGFGPGAAANNRAPQP
jgi:hypothetical protein